MPGTWSVRLALVAALLAGAYLYHVVTNISKPDIIAYFDLDRGASGAAFAVAGDLVAVSPDGLRVESICGLEVTQSLRRQARIDAIYVNDLGRELPTFTKFWTWVGTLGAAEAEPSPPDQIAFRGAYEELSSASAIAGFVTPACTCEMAARISRREKICTTLATLSERHEGDADARVIAIRFARAANFVPQSSFEACGLEYTAAAASAATATCEEQDRLPWDVTLRRLLRVIEERPNARVAEAAAD
ncbi:hypothetical protein [uncultured Albimonas sp.]|uniref:hypothetical protein n=1 Tax=uncultured Albimonas sp. TaxID=1331701 RepID=UPI0030EE9F00|tara:strand:- start:1374 stop:2111 length:738 start_codon:yes stop_codon:yes gene_type:complete